MSRPAATIGHDDILERYRADDARDVGTRDVGGAAPADRSGTSSNADRIAELRRRAAERSAAARTTAAREKAAGESARNRTANARARDAADRRDARISAARTRSANDAATETRVRQAREKYADRITTARRDLYPDSNGRVTGGPAGQGSGGAGNGRGEVWNTGHDDFTYDASCGYWNDCYWNTWGSCYPYTWSSWFCSPFYCTGLWWNSYWYWGGTWGRPWNCYWYGPFIPWRYSFVVYNDPAPVEPEIVYIEVPVAEEVVDEGLVAPAADVAPAALPPESTDPGLQRELNRAAAYYLTEGDRAFRESRYGDAAHFYAKAVEFSPDNGILYLVLSDALFATGDYRYAAYALRQALSREPELASNVIDKRDFYADPAEFDRQLAVLELFVEDHVLDMDARLVLAANYLFGGQPANAVDLLEDPFSEELRASTEGQLLLDVGRRVQFGPPAGPDAETPAEAVETPGGEEF